MNEVLILSSDTFLKQKSTSVLSEAGFRVATASALHEGLSKIDKESFDIIIIDEELPDADNYLACQKIHDSSRTPIVLLGGKVSEDVWNRVEELGFDFYLNKPFSPRELVARIKALLRRAQPKEAIAEVSKTSPLQSGGAASFEVVPPAVIPTDPAPIPEESLVKARHDGKVANLIDNLITGIISEISPEIDLSLEDVFTYLEADRILGTSGRATAEILESLAKEGLLLQRPFAKLLFSPRGSAELVRIECCPHCDSGDITNGQISRHFTGEYEKPEQNYKERLEYTCPKCKKDLKLISQNNLEFRKYYICYNCHQTFPAPEAGSYLCRNCHQTFPALATKFHCLKTGENYRRNELKESWINAYYLNEARRD
jgi:CheY-like chemotaxis protein/uncharacterized protein YbaR (Trm112 family)